jgi:hypothetical protein
MSDFEGKGSRNRTKDHKKFNDNFDAIFGKKKAKRDREKRVIPSLDPSLSSRA